MIYYCSLPVFSQCQKCYIPLSSFKPLKCGGRYVYLGVKKCLENANVCYKFEIIVDIDDIPLHKSSILQFLPIQCTVNSMQPMIMALYVSSHKPTSADYKSFCWISSKKSISSRTMVLSDVMRNLTPVIFVFSSQQYTAPGGDEILFSATGDYDLFSHNTTSKLTVENISCVALSRLLDVLHTNPLDLPNDTC